jgi:hypothetical protein
MKTHALRPEYVEFMPATLDQGVLYISRRFRTASHLCCCGCGTKIVTPLRETEYSLADRGGLVSLYPSIGNWDHPCRSHYWIKNNAVLVAGNMSRSRIDADRAADDALKDAYFARLSGPWWRRAAAWVTERVQKLFN